MMADVFWCNNERARELFYQLIERVENDLYDDEYLSLLEAYEKENSARGKVAVFAGLYMLAKGNYEAAVEYGEEALQENPLSAPAWHILAKGYDKLGDYLKVVIYTGYLYNVYQKSLNLSFKNNDIDEYLAALSLAISKGGSAPLLDRRVFCENSKFDYKDDIFFGEFLPLEKDAEYRYFVAAYLEERGFNTFGRMINEFRKLPVVMTDAKVLDLTYEVMRSQRISDKYCYRRNSADGDVILPIAGTSAQKLHFNQGDRKKDTYIGPHEYNFFRLSEDTELTSESEFIVGKPIKLGHNPQRKKFVLNILVDALSFPVIKGAFAKYMPHVYKFFQKGVIFNNHFSTSEYTYPALPAIETGCYPHRNRIFESKVCHYLSEDFVTISERMVDKGYYTINVMGGGHAIYNGATRGYDRLLITPYFLDTYVGVERIIRQLEAFAECDQFIFCHTMDIHPWSMTSYSFPTEVQLQMPLFDRLTGDEEYSVSVGLLRKNLYHENYFYQLKKLDRTLGNLLDYIEAHYNDDEYIISIYSDHGQSIFNTYPDLMSEGQVGAMWLMRGAGVPAVGEVEELTSSIDIYPTLAKLADFPVADNVDGNLPKVFGGKEREYVISNSIFPGQTYKLAIRTTDMRFNLETQNVVSQDGKADFENPIICLLSRDIEPKELTLTDELREYFYPIARNFIRSIASNGEDFTPMINNL